jgi:hypothetical protein
VSDSPFEIFGFANVPVARKTGSGSGAGAVAALSAILTLTSAQIKAGGAYTIVAAPGAGVANIPVRAIVRMARGSTAFMSANQVGRVQYAGFPVALNLLSSTLDMNWATSGAVAEKNMIYNGGTYDSAWQNVGLYDLRNRAIELSLDVATAGTTPLEFSIALFYLQVTGY